jgi:hypothetical protein
MTREEAVEKIKKLLRMKRGGTPAEIDTALGLAAELARKNGIDIESVDPDQVQEEPISHIDATTSARLRWECKYAGLVCQQFFNVTILITQDRLTSYSGFGLRGRSEFKLRMIGTDWDIQIAIYVYRFLVFHFRHCWATRRGRSRNRRAFMYGMYYGVCSKLDEKKKQEVSTEGVVLLGRAVARREQYLQSVWGETCKESTVPDTEATVSQLQGYRAGRETEIRSGLTSAGKSAPMLNGISGREGL